MSNNKNLIKTAQFAKFCNVSKQTLIYYDKIGIFHPNYKDKKGYRYYSLSQQEAFSIVSMLRELGTPLRDIRGYLKNKSTYSFIELLNEKQKEVDRRIKELKELSHLIEKRKNITQDGITLRNIKDIITHNMPEERIIISDYINSDEVVKQIKIISNLGKYISENNIRVFCIGVMVEKSKLLAGQYHNVTYFYAKTNAICEKTAIKPKGFYITTFHKGSYDTIHLAYKRAMEYIKVNDYKIIGNSYEDNILDSCTQKKEEEYLTRVSIQVEKLK